MFTQELYLVSISTDEERCDFFPLCVCKNRQAAGIYIMLNAKEERWGQPLIIDDLGSCIQLDFEKVSYQITLIDVWEPQ